MARLAVWLVWSIWLGRSKGIWSLRLRSGLLTFAHEPGLIGVMYLVTLQA